MMSSDASKVVTITPGALFSPYISHLWLVSSHCYGSLSMKLQNVAKRSIVKKGLSYHHIFLYICFWCCFHVKGWSLIFSCGWFTYFPESEACQLLHNCTNLDANICLSCLSGPAGCQPPAPQCWVQGECQGNLILTKPLETQEECLELCKSTKGCKWFTFLNPPEQLCILLQDCTSLDETASNCISGEQRCQAEADSGNIKYAYF